ncbi:MAG: sigma-E processing peptidase SpoIIGA [Oscillospiraceae bacterium]
MEPRRGGTDAVPVVYVDSVLVGNTLMNYLLLLCAARLAGLPLRRGRLFLAALVGGAYAVAVFLPGCGFLSRLPVKLATGGLLALIAFGGERALLRLTLLFFAVSCGFAGCVLALGLLAGHNLPTGGVFYTDVNAKLLVISAAAAYTVLSVVFRNSARHGGGQGELLPVTLSLEGRQVQLTALRDSGNTLCDPATGRPVLIVYADCLRGLWRPEWVPYLGRDISPVSAVEGLHGLGGRFRLLSYRSVGVENGLLLAFSSDFAEVDGARYPGQLVAISPTEISDGGGYGALWGGAERKGAKHGFQGQTEKTAGSMGAAASRQNHVHRRKRDPAAAAAPGSGGGAAGADRRGAGASNSH